MDGGVLKFSEIGCRPPGVGQWEVYNAANEFDLYFEWASALTHGHTHRPNVHNLTVNDRPATRIVLGDWYEQGSVVRWDADGPVLATLER